MYRNRESSMEKNPSIAIELPPEHDAENEHVLMREPKQDTILFGVDLSRFSTLTQVLMCIGGVFVFYLLYGYLQERLFSLPGFRKYGWFVTFLQFIVYATLAYVQKVASGNNKRKVELRTYIGIALLTVSTMGLSNTSLGYLNYPTQVIFKSCKLIPVMIGGIVIQHKRYGVIDFCAALLMCIGLVLFTLADVTVSPQYEPMGLVLISLALCADAIIGNVQEKAMREKGSSNNEMVLYSYGIGAIMIGFGLLVTQNLFPAFEFANSFGWEVYPLIFLFSVCGFVGIAFVLTLVKIFGAVIAVTVTTFRKAASMALSFMLFPKPLVGMHLTGALCVLLGIALSMYRKNKAAIDQRLCARTASAPRQGKTFTA